MRAVSVRRQYIELSDQLILGPPKSRAGIRTVGIPEAIIPALREHFGAYVGPEKTDLVFTGAVCLAFVEAMRVCGGAR